MTKSTIRFKGEAANEAFKALSQEAVDRAAIISWRVEWWIQECRPPSTWIDYGRKATERDLLLRIEELTTEVPSRQFRAISRFIEDRIV